MCLVVPCLLLSVHFPHLSSISTPHNVSKVLSRPKWKDEMEEEMQALEKNNTWILWIFVKKKYKL